MATEIPFRRDLDVVYGLLETVAPGLRRIVARNPSPFTYKGTGTYVIGTGQVAVIDPGPDLPEHVDALLAALGGETVTHILVTHTHRDHSPAAAALKQATGAPTYGYGPHAGGRRNAGPGEEGGDWDFLPDIVVRDGDTIEAPCGRFQAVHTPGHTSNHVCFAWLDRRILFSGDHVMGWSTSVIIPPDGNMTDYFASLAKLLERDETVYWPTHGSEIANPRGYVRAFIAHRCEREAGILDCLRQGPTGIEAMIPVLYVGLAANLHRAASRSVQAHLIDLVGRGLVACAGEPTLEAEYRLISA